MQWKLIQKFDEGSSLYEDQDGLRALLCPVEVPGHVWALAAPQGVSMLLTDDPTPKAGWWVCSVEEFLEQRTEDSVRGVYKVPFIRQWKHPEPPSYRQFREAINREGKQPKLHDRFVNIHSHSDFSALDGLSKLSEMSEVLSGYGQEHISVTDHGVCAGHYHLMKEAKAKSLHPLFGIEAYFVPDRTVKEKEERYDYNHIILIAKTSQGLMNLWALSTEANRTGFYGKPRCDWELLERYGEGLICSTACIRGPIAEPLKRGHDLEARNALGKLLNIFDDRLYVELGSTAMEDQMMVNKQLVELAHEYSIPVLAAVDSHYPRREDYEAHQIWIKAGTYTSGDDTEQKLFADNQPYHLMMRQEVEDKLSYLPWTTSSKKLSTIRWY